MNEGRKEEGRNGLSKSKTLSEHAWACSVLWLVSSTTYICTHVLLGTKITSV